MRSAGETHPPSSVLGPQSSVLGPLPAALPEFDAIAAAVLAERRVPQATYRLQFNAEFTFRDATALVPYLHDLGISDIYASPILRARPGSTHGYDICDHSQLNPALGSPQEFDALVAALRERDMGLVIDVVPNHMGIGDACNAWWIDVLENGPSSPYASYFDIDWRPVKNELENKVLLPVLGEQYGDVLERGQLRLSYADGAFAIVYGALELPVAPRTTMPILQAQLDRLAARVEADDQQLVELQSILTALSYLPPRTEDDPAKRAERLREKQVIKRRLAALCDSGAEARAALDAAIAEFNGSAGAPRSFDRLDALITAQPYRPAFWRVAAEEINYRRFFDINDLAAIRVELPEVFADTHRLIFELLADRSVTGLRIDHPDGLWDPPGYFRHLQERYLADAVAERGGRPADERLEQAAALWLDKQAGAASRPLYVIAEKILSEREPLPPDWAVDGTTGYDFLSATTGLFVDGANERAFDQIYGDFISAGGGAVPPFAELVHASKLRIMRGALASEMNALSSQLARITEKNRRYRDFTLRGISEALREVIACLEVYRSYISGPDAISERDRRYLGDAIAEARRRNPGIPRAILSFLRDTLLLRNLDQFAEEDRPGVLNIVMKFQQITGPVMAKSVEDTAFYMYNRLVALNDVGGSPAQFGTALADFHQQNAERQRNWPNAMLTLTTHDTKRSEDVRARISVLSELPAEWSAAIERWRALNADKKSRVDGQLAPDANDEYLLYQTLLGVWPFEPAEPGSPGADMAALCERIVAYMHKATKEAKVHTSWINPDEDYDAALERFIRAALDDAAPNPFLDELRAFARLVAYYGQFNALAQQLLKLTVPGVPDIYQGNDLWDLSLVDPDNRRPVDYSRRRELLAELRQRMAESGGDQAELARDVQQTFQDGRVKLYLTAQALRCRRAQPELFAHGDYQPLAASGARRAHVCAFARSHAGAAVLVVAPRLVAGLTAGAERAPLGEPVWGDTWLELPEAQRDWRYRNCLTGATLDVDARGGRPGLALAAVLRDFPVALLERVEPSR